MFDAFRLHFEDVALLVNCIPVFIGLSGFKFHGFVAQGTDWGLRHYWHTRSPGHELLRLYKRPTPELGTAEGCVRRLPHHTTLVTSELFDVGHSEGLG